MHESIKGTFLLVFKVPLDRVEHLTMQDSEEWDSLKHMELIMVLEDNFQIDLSFDEIVQMQSFESIVRILEAKGCS